MGWLHLVAFGSAGIASMTAAMKGGNIEEASRQGVLAGPVAVERALASGDRMTQMAGIAAAPQVDDRAELLVALAALASGPDWRTAIPAARAARTITRELSRLSVEGIPDDLAVEEIVGWRDRWGEVALDRERWISVRVTALEIAASLDELIQPAAARDDATSRGRAGSASPSASFSTAAAERTHGVGIDLGSGLTDPDPAFRRALVSLVPVPLPVVLRAPLANIVIADSDPLVALGAAQALCGDLVSDPPAPILDALGTAGLDRLRTVVSTEGSSTGVLRDAARCLQADTAPASAAALRTIRARLR